MKRGAKSLGNASEAFIPASYELNTDDRSLPVCHSYDPGPRYEFDFEATLASSTASRGLSYVHCIAIFKVGSAAAVSGMASIFM